MSQTRTTRTASPIKPIQSGNSNDVLDAPDVDDTVRQGVPCVAPARARASRSPGSSGSSRSRVSGRHGCRVAAPRTRSSTVPDSQSVIHSEEVTGHCTDSAPDSSDISGDFYTVFKGRGAVSNAVGRYEAHQREAVDDGWSAFEEDTLLPRAPGRQEIVDSSRRVITRNTSPDIPFDRSINPYRGCEHGCIYCFARPTHAWLGMSPGLDFETRITYKPDAAAQLERELAEPGYLKKGVRPINLGTNTDPYQPMERDHQITRALLEVMSRQNHPVGITTKGTLIERDIDLLADMATRRLVNVAVSLPTLSNNLSRTLEPRAAAPSRRLQTIRRLSEAGIPVAVLVAPVIPLLSDGEIENILEASAGAGATAAGYVLLRLPLEVRELFEQWLHVHEPGKAEHVMSLVRDTRGGATYQSQWGVRQRGTGSYAALIRQRFKTARKRAGLERRLAPSDCSRFEAPPRATAQNRTSRRQTNAPHTKSNTPSSGTDLQNRKSGQMSLF